VSFLPVDTGGILFSASLAVIRATGVRSRRLQRIVFIEALLLGGLGLVLAFAGCVILNVAADIAAIMAGEIRFDQLAVGMILESVLALLLFAYQRSQASPLVS
jgi:ABC-type antimicrobial peptide transport system permease subunit